MLSADLACSLDPVRFASDRLGLELDPVQAGLLRRRSRRSLLNCCRQWGKSTTTGVGALHESEFREGSRTIILSPSQRQSSLLLAVIESQAEKARIRTRPLVVEGVAGLRMAGGEVIALPSAEATTRGFAGCTWLIVDEAARVLDVVYMAARAYLATTDGRISLLSTPFGRRGFYHAAHESGRWDVVTARADGCPRISAEFLREERETQPLLWFQQEYECQFVETVAGLFSHQLVLQSLTDEVQPLCL